MKRHRKPLEHLPRLKVLYILIAIWVLLIANALGETDLEFIGFSEDGSYLAYEQYGIQDGSGFPISEIYVVDVDNNSYLVAPFVMSSESGETFTLEEIRSANRLSAQATLGVYGIVSENTGQKVVSRLPTDIFADSLNVYFPKSHIAALYRYKADDSDYSTSNDYYQLSLNTQPAVTDACEFNAMFEYPEPALLTLTLRDAETQALQVLQEDTVLFESRNCAFGYVIRDVYRYQRFNLDGNVNKLAVFLSSFQVGFEGPDTRWHIVTGAISDIEK